MPSGRLVQGSTPVLVHGLSNGAGGAKSASDSHTRRGERFFLWIPPARLPWQDRDLAQHATEEPPVQVALRQPQPTVMCVPLPTPPGFPGGLPQSLHWQVSDQLSNRAGNAVRCAALAEVNVRLIELKAWVLSTV